MRGLGSALLPSIDLDHLRDVERVHSSEGISRNQHDTTVGIDLLLGIAELDGLQNCTQLSVEATGAHMFSSVRPTSRLIQVRQICQVLTGFQHRGVHQGREVGIVVDLQLGLGRLDSFGLFSPHLVSLCP